MIATLNGETEMMGLLFAKFSHKDQWVSKKDVVPATKAAVNFARKNNTNHPISSKSNPSVTAKKQFTASKEEVGNYIKYEFGNKVQNGYFKFKGLVKVTRSATLVAFERALLVGSP